MRHFIAGLAIIVIAASLPSWVLANDSVTAQTIMRKLQEQQRLGGLQKVEDDIVWLRGRVASNEQAAMAVGIARHIDGVERLVLNDLTISPAQTADGASGTVSDGGAAQLRQPPSIGGASRQVEFASTGAIATTSSSRRSPGPRGNTVNRAHTGRPASSQRPLAFAPASYASRASASVLRTLDQPSGASPIPSFPPGSGAAPVRYDNPHLPGYAWPSYAAYPNYAGVTYPRQYSPTAWPFIGPFYPYPQVPLGWRKVTLEWDDGWWMLDFKSRRRYP